MVHHDPKPSTFQCHHPWNNRKAVPVNFKNLKYSSDAGNAMTASSQFALHLGRRHPYFRHSSVWKDPRQAKWGHGIRFIAQIRLWGYKCRYIVLLKRPWRLWKLPGTYWNNFKYLNDHISRPVQHSWICQNWDQNMISFHGFGTWMLQVTASHQIIWTNVNSTSLAVP